MVLNIRKKTTIRFNNREYGSIDEMPMDLRKQYEGALKAALQNSGNMGILPTGKILFNGTEYGSEEEMPANVRELYRHIISLVAENESGDSDPADDREGESVSYSDSSDAPDASRTPQPANEIGSKMGRRLILYAALIGVVFSMIGWLDKTYGKENIARYFQNFLPLIVIAVFFIAFYRIRKFSRRCKYCGTPIARSSVMTKKTICIKCGREVIL